MASGHGHGSMSMSMKFIRLLIMLFNLSFICVGSVLLAIGVYVIKDPKMQQLRPLLNPDLTSAYSQSLSNIEVFAIGIIAIGGALLAIGFLGKDFRNIHHLFSIFLIFRLLWSYKRFSIFTCSLCGCYWCNHYCGNCNRCRFYCISKSISI
jgi:hypothetical protein